MSSFSRNTFDKLKHYVGVRLQQGVPLVDADWNEQEDIRKYELRAFLKWFVGNGVPKGNDGFCIEAIPAENDFLIKGGDGTPDGAGRCLVEGWDAINESNLKYTAQPLFNNPALAAKWGVDPVQLLTTPTIATPTPAFYRTDTVYLDVWEREVDAEEDYEHLVNPKIGIETCVRLKREWAVRVKEGANEPPTSTADHVFYPLAYLRRKLGVAAIDDIKDLRRSGLAVLSKQLTIKDGNVGIGTTSPGSTLDVNGTLKTTELEVVQGLLVGGDVQVNGRLTVLGEKSGYVTDRFINQSGDVLEQGDVIVLEGRSAYICYGVDENIPVPEVDLTTTVYDKRACGIVSEILVEEEPKLPNAEEATQANRRIESSTKAVRFHSIKRLQIFSAKEQEGLDRKKIATGQIGTMVTLGCFAHCKVDADIAPIEVGDLLTTSPTKGHAQKVLEPEKAIGTIIGKALSSLKNGKGKIPVLVMLQ